MGIATADSASGAPVGCGGRLRPRTLAVVAGLLLIATTALFLYSLCRRVAAFDSGRFSAVVQRGGLAIRVSSPQPPTGLPERIQGFDFLGVTAIRVTHVVGYSYCFASPFWLLLIVFGVLPAREADRLLRLWRIERRRAARQCTNCGYDLRASPEACPECGSVNALG